MKNVAFPSESEVGPTNNFPLVEVVNNFVGGTAHAAGTATRREIQVAAFFIQPLSTASEEERTGGIDSIPTTSH